MDTPVQTQQDIARRQLQSAKVSNGLKIGIKMLEDDSVIAPIKYVEGIVDLKWLLRTLLSGNAFINFVAPVQPLKEAAAGEGSGGNGSQNVD